MAFATPTPLENPTSDVLSLGFDVQSFFSLQTEMILLKTVFVIIYRFYAQLLSVVVVFNQNKKGS
jgi:hypothetical protein